MKQGLRRGDWTDRARPAVVAARPAVVAARPAVAPAPG